MRGEEFLAPHFDKENKMKVNISDYLHEKSIDAAKEVKVAQSMFREG